MTLANRLFGDATTAIMLDERESALDLLQRAAAADPSYVRWRFELAAKELVVIGVEFRNGGGKLGPFPFPAGLNDCATGLQWVHANRAELGITKLVVSGESGGGNLALASALKAKQDGYLAMPLDGVWLRAPYLHNGAVPTLADLLEPPHARPERFHRGYDVYDPEKVGFVTTGPSAEREGFLLDTTERGNGKGGHLYGTELPPEQKRALLEFLKTL